MCEHLVLISGCSGGGKSTLLAELQARGHAAVDEPGRRIVKHELETGGTAVPWIDPRAFLNRVIEMSIADIEAAKSRTGWVFLDRGLIDAASALEELTGEPVLQGFAEQDRFHRQVFLTPPWPEIFVSDAERQHGFDAALDEYRRLERVFPALGYEVIILPKTTVVGRADFPLATLY